MIVLLDNGHGGLINGVYQTPGKRSPIWADGSQLFEGEFNRAIVNGIIEQLTVLKIPYVNIAPEYTDITLEERVKRANSYYGSPCFYVSVHSNAGGGTGSEIFTTPGQTKSDSIATVFAGVYKEVFPERKFRADLSDGDPDKEANFYVIKNTKMPAILTENFFMDNEDECKNLLMTKAGRQRVVDYHVKSIVKVKQQLF
ncbi:cell wall hydrolase [Flavobacterium akiainvivens]|uniref:N-acetylmuramoyl-L-alanine amidase n=1 Tax=Flavobacterium akiainvivens TaxID=1202724 RepID=A0A0M8MG43_9FLAO|nr:N-acetylmuramoyl-L-alanine amidase [Flavobacterium akiainvivens]KOS08164.1 cell wall hydrolase [Flavobacterium akiainvivens]SFQ42522.1 N-acetylmuramoyl-L-alanine amidase [Flavobacterium akiainvivens]